MASKSGRASQGPRWTWSVQADRGRRQGRTRVVWCGVVRCGVVRCNPGLVGCRVLRCGRGCLLEGPWRQKGTRLYFEAGPASRLALINCIRTDTGKIVLGTPL